MRSAFLTVAAFVLIPLWTVSSQAVQPKSGDRIRITAAPNALDNRIARVLSVRHDSLFLHVAPAETLAVARVDVARIEVSAGRGRHTLQGAGIGALIGAASGALMGYASGDDRGWCCFTAGEKAALTAVGLGGLAAGIGAVVGAQYVSERWTSVPLGSAEASPPLLVRPGGTRLGMSVAF